MIDLRSDTVTKPGPAMLSAMMAAQTGDDVYGEDPAVNALEAKISAMTGKAAALFVTSGTQGNLLAVMSHCGRGEEYIAGQDAHTYRFEGGGAAVLGGVQPQPLPFNPRGELDLEDVRGVIKPDNFHFAITRLVCLENTIAGKPLSMAYLKDYVGLTREFGLRRHLDGARVFNAAVKLNVPVKDICGHFDSVSICLSKGLGCPVGSVLVGDEAFIKQARRLRKMLGGGMRQAGILAAAGIYALDNNISRLTVDHDNAARLAAGLVEIGVPLTEPVHTNMVMLDSARLDMGALKQFLYSRDINISGPRLVTHLDVSSDDIDQVLAAFTQFQRDA